MLEPEPPRVDPPPMSEDPMPEPPPVAELVFSPDPKLRPPDEPELVTCWMAVDRVLVAP